MEKSPKKKQIEAFLMGLLAFGFAPGTAKF
jgi:hypothetical protein